MATSPKMSRRVWLAAMARAIEAEMPDGYPGGYGRWLAQHREAEGGYDNYVAGKYAPDMLWEPEDDE